VVLAGTALSLVPAYKLLGTENNQSSFGTLDIYTGTTVLQALPAL